jgi:dCMP deaminase
MAKRIKIRPDIDEYFLKIASVVGQRSTCLRHNVGVVLVRDKQILSSGYNGAPKGVPDCLEIGCLRDQQNIDSGTKHEICRAVHGEQNAIIQAALHGVSTEGSTMYITHSPCILCAKMIVNAGIVRVVCTQKYPDSEWVSLFRKAGIKLDIMPMPDLSLADVSERVLVIDRNHFNKAGKFEGVKTDKLDTYYKQILGAVKYADRKSAESDKSLKQIINQFLVRFGDEYYISRRLDTSDEERLRDMNYIAFGGHINPVDTTEATGDVIKRAAQRELKEELECDIKSMKLIALVNDEKMAVSSYHLAIFYLVELKSKKCHTREKDQYDGFWVHKKDLGKYFDNGDSWSRYVWKDLIKPGKIG